YLATGVFNGLKTSLHKAHVFRFIQERPVQPVGGSYIQLIIKNDGRVTRSFIQHIWKDVLDSAVIGNKINTMVEPQPQVFVFVGENTEHIVVLKTFQTRKLLNGITFFVYYDTALHCGGKSKVVFINSCGAV